MRLSAEHVHFGVKKKKIKKNMASGDVFVHHSRRKDRKSHIVLS